MATTTPETRGVFSYLPEGRLGSPFPYEDGQLASVAAIEPILKRWRSHCPDGLIDDNGKIRNVYTKAERGAEDSVDRVIRELNRIPEAVEEL